MQLEANHLALVRQAQIEGLYHLHLQGYDTAGLFSSIGHAFKSAAKAVGKVAAKVTKVATLPITAPTKLLTKAVAKIPVLGGIVGAVNNLALLPINVTQQVLEGGRIDKVALANFKTALASVKTIGPYIQTVISFVPGIGTGISAAIGAGLALANGQSISQALVAGVKGALPGGPAAQAAFSVAQAAIERKPISQIALAALPISDQQKKLLNQGLSAAKDIASGKNVAQSVIDNAVKSLPPALGKAVQIGMAMGHAKSLQDAMKIGAGGAASAALSIASATATMPKALMPAMKVAANVARGGVTPANVLAVAKGQVPASIMAAMPKNASALLSNAAKLAKGGVTPAKALALAKQTAPKGITNMRSPIYFRAGSIPPINLARKVVALSAVPSATKAVVDAVRRNPALMGASRQLLAQNMRTNGATVNDAMAILARSKPGGLLPWRSLAPHTVSFVKRFAPNAAVTALRHAHTNIAGLDSTGTVYIVEKGDGPWAIAQKLTGNGAKWKELLAYNKDKKPTIDKNIWVGERINLPPTWQKPVNINPPPITALPSAPPPSIAPLPDPVTQVTTAASSIVPAILQAKAILAAWGKTDGINQAGLTDYGMNPADMATTMGPRDTLMLGSFQAWDNKTLNDNLPIDGNLDARTLQALQAWATARATSVVPAVASAATPSVSPGIPQSPPAVEVIPTVIGGTDPTIVVTPKPAPGPTPAVAKPGVPAKGGGMGLIAGGAVIGGLLFGVPGALIGAAGGAAIS